MSEIATMPHPEQHSEHHTENGSGFFSIFNHALSIAKQHWLIFLILIIISFAATFATILITGGIGLGAMMVGGAAGAVAMVTLMALVLVVLGAFISLATLKIVHLTISNKEVKIGEVLTYGLKNILSFIWAGIVGTVYALRWSLIIVVGVPLLLQIVNTVAKFPMLNDISEGGGIGEMGGIVEYPGVRGDLFSMLPVINFVLMALAIVGIILMMIALIRIIFLGYAFVADEKRGVEAAKASIELVAGRWWKTFGYFFLNTIILGISIMIIVFIVTLVLGIEAGQMANGLLSQLATILVVIFSAVLYGAYKKTR